MNHLSFFHFNIQKRKEEKEHNNVGTKNENESTFILIPITFRTFFPSLIFAQ